MTGIGFSVNVDWKNKAVVALVMLALVLTIVQSMTSIAATAMTTFKGSVITDSGETLTIEVKSDSGRPPSLLHAMLMNSRRDAWRAWNMAWKVGTTEVTTVDNGLSITVTGANVQSMATVDYYIKAVSASDSEKWTKELDMSGTSVTVGGAAHENSTGSLSIDTHLSNMGLAIDQSQTVDYYIYVKAMTTGIISEENIVAEIEEIKFDTVTYMYPSTISLTLNDPTIDGYLKPTGFSYNDDDNTLIMTDTSGTNFRAFIEWNVSSIPDGSIITAISFKYHGMQASPPNIWIADNIARPSTSTPLEIATGARTALTASEVVSAGPNQEIAFDRNLDTLTDYLPDDWFAILVLSAQATNTAQIYSSEYGSVNPKPTLYVQYEGYAASWSWYITPPLSIISMPVGKQVIASIALVVVGGVVLNALKKRKKTKRKSTAAPARRKKK